MEEILPGIYLDGAHNLGAVRAFCESVRMLEASMGKEELPVILFSAVEDKDYETMIAELCRETPAAAYVVTEVEDGRRVSAGELGDIFLRYTDRPVCVRAKFAEAWETALARRGKRGRIYCLGSLYLAGMIKRSILEEQEDDGC